MTATNSIFLIAVSGCCHYETHTKQNDRVRTTPAQLQTDMTQIRKKKIFTLLSANAFLNDPINHELLNTVGTSELNFLICMFNTFLSCCQSSFSEC